MKITLVSINANARHFSLGAFALGAMLRTKRPAVEVVVRNYSVHVTSRNILFDLMADDSDVMGFSLHHGNIHKVLEVIQPIKRLRPATTIVVGGIDAFCIDDVIGLRGIADYAAIGEGEKTILGLLEWLEGEGCFDEVPNLYRVDELNSRDVTPVFHGNLDDFPSPYLTGAFDEYDRYPTVFIETYRGCVNNCKFCFENRGRRRVAFFSEERVREDLIYLMKTKEVPRIEFYDTIFNVYPERTKDLLEFIIRNNRRTSFIGEFQLEWLDRETIDLMGRANFSVIESGLQTVNTASLRRSGRESDLDRFQQNAEDVLSRTKILLCLDAMFGLQHDSYEDFKATLNFIGDLKAGQRRALPILFVTNIHPGTLTFNQQPEDLVFEGGGWGTFLRSDHISPEDTRRFYRLFLAYLLLRITFRWNMFSLTTSLRNGLGMTLSDLYEELGSFLATYPATVPIFEEAEWYDFRSNTFVRAYLEALDRRFILDFVESRGGVSRLRSLQLKTIVELERRGRRAPTLEL